MGDSINILISLYPVFFIQLLVVLAACPWSISIYFVSCCFEWLNYWCSHLMWRCFFRLGLRGWRLLFRLFLISRNISSLRCYWPTLVSWNCCLGLWRNILQCLLFYCVRWWFSWRRIVPWKTLRIRSCEAIWTQSIYCLSSCRAVSCKDIGGLFCYSLYTTSSTSRISSNLWRSCCLCIRSITGEMRRLPFLRCRCLNSCTSWWLFFIWIGGRLVLYLLTALGSVWILPDIGVVVAYCRCIINFLLDLLLCCCSFIG